MPNAWVSDRAADITPSATVSMTERVKRLRAAGEPVIGLSTGTPDFDTPTHIKAAGKAALDEDRTYITYSPAAGLVELRDAIADKLKRENDIAVGADEIMVTIGVKEGIYVAAQACFNPGDEVLVPTPTWVSYDACLRLAGAVPVPVPCRAESNFQLDPADLAARVTKKTRAIILNTPCNPTGHVLTREELAAIAELAIKHDLLVLSDEIYEYMVYDGARSVSIGSLPGMAERTLTFNGFSKAYAMTGWRVGYVAGPKAILRNLLKIHGHSVYCACSFAQKAAAVAITSPQDERIAYIQGLAERRNALARGLDDIPGVRCPAPEGGIFCFPDISELGMTDKECAEFFLDKAKVATLPGSAFGPGGEGHLRVMFARRDAADLGTAVRQMRDAIAAR